MTPRVLTAPQAAGAARQLCKQAWAAVQASASRFQEDTQYAAPCRQLCIPPSCCTLSMLPAGGCVYSPHHPQHRQPVEDTARQQSHVPA